MIYTVTLNPSIDYIVRLDKLTSGITNRTTSEEYYYGGKGINVSLVLAELDLDSTAYGFVAGFTGKAIENGIRNDHIITDFIKLKEGISRINIKIKAGEETEINCQGPHIDEQELERLLQKIDRIQPGDTLILAGSIPNTMPDDTYEIMMQRIGDKDVRIVVDATKQLLVNSLKYHPFLIKPNRQELSEIFNVEVKTEEDIRQGAPKARCAQRADLARRRGRHADRRKRRQAQGRRSQGEGHQHRRLRRLHGSRLCCRLCQDRRLRLRTQAGQRLRQCNGVPQRLGDQRKNQ